MTDFSITERTISTRKVNCFIPYPDDNEGGGWSYNASITDFDNLTIDHIGNIPLKHLIASVSVMETAIREDKNRMEEYGSISFDFLTYEEEAVFRKEVEEFKNPIVGMDANDFWICNGATISEDQKSISTITLLRASNRYLLMQYGYPMLSFDAHELEAITSLLKRFLPESEQTAQ